MKILRIADVADNRTGGMSRVIHGSGDAMIRAGHRVDYLFSSDLGHVSSPRLRRFMIPVRVAKQIDRLNQMTGPYDVVEIHEPSAAYYIWRRKRSRQLPPCVILSFGIEARGQAAKLAYRRLHRLRVSLKQKISPWSVILQARYSLRSADHVVCFNSEDVAYLTEMGRCPSDVTRTHSGIEHSFLKAGNESRTESAANPRILFLGSWIERKGVHDLVAAMTHVFASTPSARLTIAGCGCAEAEVLNCFADADRRRISVIPQINTDSELIDIYRKHDIFLLPSYFEGQPLAMLEAAALGLAIVTTNVCGMRDFIEHNRNGILVSPGDSEAIAAAIEHLANRPDEIRRLADAARDKVQRFTWDAVADDMLSAYEAAMAPKSGSVRR